MLDRSSIILKCKQRNRIFKIGGKLLNLVTLVVGETTVLHPVKI